MKIRYLLIAAALALVLTLPCLAASTGDNMKLIYLSDMEWKSASIYSGANNGTPTRDENVAGEEIWLYESYFEKGVGLHADMGKLAYIEVDISGRGFKTFLTYVGTAESELYDVSMASVRFTFKVDGKVMLKTDVIRPNKPPEMITVDVDGGNTLRIEMDDGGDGISGDWGSLGYAVFSDSSDPDGIIKALTKKDEQTTATETKTETETETETEKTTETEEVTEAPTETEAETTDCGLPPKESKFPVIPVIIGAAAVVCAATVIAIIIKRRKK